MTKTTFRFTVSTFLIFALAGIMSAQKFRGQTPVKERLLNELSILLWKDASAEKLNISLRIHSGAAFDPEGKEGTAMLLTEVMFPATGIYEDFRDDLGGSLDVTVHYDYIQIDMVASKDKLVSVLEILASAVSNAPIDAESAEAAKKLRLEKLALDSANPEYIATEETAGRIYGDFPYGRSRYGTEESIPEIDFADLIFFKQKFLTAENATLSISGDIDTRFTYLAARRLMGPWQKGSRKVPANFTLPELPDAAPLIVNIDAASWRTESFGVESTGRKSSDYYSSKVLSRVLANRLDGNQKAKFDSQSYLLRGYFMLYRSMPKTAGNEESTAGNPLKAMLMIPISENEFKSALNAEISDYQSRKDVLNWFDISTYGLKSVDDEFAKLKAVTIKDVNAHSAKLMKNRFVEVHVIPLEAANPMNDNDSEDPNDPH